MSQTLQHQGGGWGDVPQGIRVSKSGGHYLSGHHVTPALFTVSSKSPMRPMGSVLSPIIFIMIILLFINNGGISGGN